MFITNEKMRAARARRAHLPWPVVHGAAASMFIAFGVAYGMVVFFPFVGTAIGVPAWELTFMFSLTGGLYYLIGAGSGWLTDRFGARHVVTSGLVLLSGGLLAASQAGTPMTFATCYVLGVGCGVGLVYVPSSAAVQLHAREHGALAGGIASSGIGFGTMAVPPLCEELIGWLGWRAALMALALLLLPGLLASRRLAQVPAAERRRVIALSTAPLASVRFAVLYLAYVCVGLVTFVPIAGAVPFVVSKGLPGTEAVALLVLVGSGSILGRFGYGYLADHVGARRASVQCAAIIMVSFLLMAMQESIDLLRMAALLFGLGYGGMTGLTAATAAEVMGVAHFGGTLGLLMTSRALGILFGPWCVTLAATWLGDFTLPYLICAALAVVAGVLLHMERAPAQGGAVPTAG